MSGGRRCGRLLLLRSGVQWRVQSDGVPRALHSAAGFKGVNVRMLFLAIEHEFHAVALEHDTRLLLPLLRRKLDRVVLPIQTDPHIPA